MNGYSAFLSAFGNSPVALCAMDGRFVSWSNAFKTLCRPIEENPSSLRLFDFDPNKAVSDKLLRFQTSAQKMHWIKGCASTVTLDDTPLLFLQIEGVMDEKDLTKSESNALLLKKLRLITEHSGAATTLYTVDGQAEYISPVTEQIFGYTPEEMMQFHPASNIIEEDVSGYKTYAKTVINGEKIPSAFEFGYKKKDGDLVWLSLKMNLIRDETGLPTHVQSSIRDITEKKNYEKQLEFSERNASAILNSSDSAIFLVDQKYNIISVNDKTKVLTLKLFGDSLKKGDNILSGAFATEQMVQSDFLTRFEKAFSGQAIDFYREFKFGKKVLWFRIKYTPIWSSDGQVYAVSWIATDVTHERKTEEYTLSLLQRLNLANSAGGVGIWEFDFETQLIKFDDQCIQLLDNKIGVQTSLPRWAKAYQKKDRSMLLATFDNKGIPINDMFSLEMELDLNTASKFHLLKGKIQYKDGIAIKASGVLMDISSAKNWERNLEKNKNQLNQAQQLAGVGAIEIDLKNMQMAWSEHNFYIHLIRYKKVPSFLSYVHHIIPQDRQNFFNCIRKALAQPSLQEVIYHFENQGQSKVFHLKIKSVYYRNKVTKLIGTIQDITTHRSLEKSLEHKEQLIEDNKKAMSQFSFMNSHKVRAPLSNILGLVQLLRLEGDSSLIEMLERSAEELDMVIHEVNEILSN